MASEYIDYKLIPGIGVLRTNSGNGNLNLGLYSDVVGAIGDSGNDSITGNSQDNLLWGGSGGGDTLNGGAGSDAFFWGKNNGDDKILSTGSSNGLDCANFYDVSLSELGVNFSGNDVVFSLADGSSLVLEDWLSSGSSSRIQSFDLGSDHVVYAWNGGAGARVELGSNAYRLSGSTHIITLDPGNSTLCGGNASDLIDGGNGDDQLWGGSGGNDTMVGGGGTNTYWWGTSTGNDIVVTQNANDRIMCYDIQKQSISASVQGQDCILTAGNSTLTIKNWKNYSIDSLVFADGSTTSLQQLVNKGSSSTHQFNISFDYSLDSSGFFKNHPERQACLEEAAALWEQYITDDFATVAAGSGFYIWDPSTGENKYMTAKTNIDDVVIYVGATDTDDGSTATGGPAWPAGYDTLERRWSSYFDFEPWAGIISFDSKPEFSDGTSANWWFDPTPQTADDAETLGYNQYDFITVAVHEIGHVLGIVGGINAFDWKVNYFGNFVGTNAVKANGGNYIPMYDDSHPDGYNGNFPMEVVMAYGGYSYVGHRVEPSAIDLGMLADIGYKIKGINA